MSKSLLENAVILKKGKEKPILGRHHWIFSGAIQNLPEFEDGSLLPVFSYEKLPLGWGYFNRKSALTGRMISFGEVEGTDPKKIIEKHLDFAHQLRVQFFQNGQTTAYRLVNGEGDLLPGLIIDCYNDTFVLQISTLGMKKLTPLIVSWLVKTFNPKAIYEKSLLPSRKEEGLSDYQGIHVGEVPAAEIIISENGLKFAVSILHGQKSGFFLDHREMREQIRHLSKNKKVLNCFSYTGGFSVYAAAGGAKSVDSVDISESAIIQAKKNMVLNGFDSDENHYFAEDVFLFLREKPLNYDLVILDPPAFAKKQKDVIQACRGYKEINRVAMQKMPKGSLLLTCSCSYHVDEKLFQQLIFQAAVEAGKEVKILGRHRMGFDHPINICHPESDYLKSLLLLVN